MWRIYLIGCLEAAVQSVEPDSAYSEQNGAANVVAHSHHQARQPAQQIAADIQVVDKQLLCMLAKLA